MIKIKPHTFMYVDKERIVPWLDEQIECNKGVKAHVPCVLKKLRKRILDGQFDWQPAE